MTGYNKMSQQDLIDKMSQLDLNKIVSRLELNNMMLRKDLMNTSRQDRNHMMSLQDLKDIMSRYGRIDMMSQLDLNDTLSQQDLNDTLSQQDLNDTLSQQDLNDTLSQQDLNDTLSQQDLNDMSQQDLNDMSQQQDLNDMMSQQVLNDMMSQQDLNDMISRWDQNYMMSQQQDLNDVMSQQDLNAMMSLQDLNDMIMQQNLIDMMSQEDLMELLHTAVSANDASTLERLLAQKKMDPNTMFGDSLCPNAKSILHIACNKGHTECVRVLLKAGAMPDIHDKWGCTPLQYSLCSQFLDTAAALLDFVGPQAAEQMVNNKMGMTQRTCIFGVVIQGSLEGVHLLLRYGAQLDVVDNLGQSPLMACLGSHRWQEDLVPVLKLLVTAGVDLELKNKQGYTALQIATLRMNAEAVQWLLTAGADINALDNNGRPAIVNLMRYYTITGGANSRNPRVQPGEKYLQLLDLLVRHGADLSLPTEQSNALINCMDSPSMTSFRLTYLLDHGADPNVLVNEENSPLLHALRKRDYTVATTLLEHCCSAKTMGRVWREGSRPCSVTPVEVLLQDRDMINDEDGSDDDSDDDTDDDSDDDTDDDSDRENDSLTLQDAKLMRKLLCAGDDSCKYREKRELIMRAVQFMYSAQVITTDQVAWFTRKFYPVFPSLVQMAKYAIREFVCPRHQSTVRLMPVPTVIKDHVTDLEESL